MIVRMALREGGAWALADVVADMPLAPIKLRYIASAFASHVGGGRHCEGQFSLACGAQGFGVGLRSTLAPIRCLSM